MSFTVSDIGIQCLLGGRIECTLLEPSCERQAEKQNKDHGASPPKIKVFANYRRNASSSIEIQELKAHKLVALC